MSGIAALCRRLPAPVLNPPDRVPPTRRDRIGRSWSGFPTRSFRRRGAFAVRALEVLADATEALETPMLLRPAGSHGGNDLSRIELGSEIADYLGRVPGDEHYLTEFHDYRSADGYFRKYRFAFIDCEVFPYHLAIGKDWLVHYWRTPMSEAWMKREEEAFLADFEKVFPPEAAQAVREVARRLDLDCGGMDCALTRDGRVLLFEANATMNCSSPIRAPSFPTSIFTCRASARRWPTWCGGAALRPPHGASITPEPERPDPYGRRVRRNPSGQNAVPSGRHCTGWTGGVEKVMTFLGGSQSHLAVSQARASRVWSSGAGKRWIPQPASRTAPARDRTIRLSFMSPRSQGTEPRVLSFRPDAAAS